MIWEAFRYPFESDEWIKTILIGTVLSLLSVLVVPLLFVNGYIVRVLRAGSMRDPTPPTFDEWGALLIDGLRYVAVVLVYLFGAVFVSALFSVFTGFAPSMGLDTLTTTLRAWMVGSLLLFAVVVYLLPAALTGMARAGSIGGAFDFETLKTTATSPKYFIAVVLALVVGLVFGLIGSLLSLLLVGFVVSFYGQIVTFYLLGRGVGDALGTTDRDGTAAAPVAE